MLDVDACSAKQSDDTETSKDTGSSHDGSFPDRNGGFGETMLKLAEFKYI